MSNFLENLEQHQKALLLIGCLPVPFDSATIMIITCFVASEVGKIYKLRIDKIEQTGSTKNYCGIHGRFLFSV